MTSMLRKEDIKRAWELHQRSRRNGRDVYYDESDQLFKTKRALVTEVRVLGQLNQHDLARYFEVAEDKLSIYHGHLIVWLHFLRTSTKPIRSALWSLGYRLTSSNAEWNHQLSLNMIAVWRWCATCAEARRSREEPASVWREAKDGGKEAMTAFVTYDPVDDAPKAAKGPCEQAPASAPRAALPAKGSGWHQLALDDSAEGYDGYIRDLIDRTTCYNCFKPGSHSATYCRASRRSDLMCSLCMTEAHHERDCNGPPGTPKGMWKAKRDKHIGWMKSQEVLGVDGAPATG